MREYKNMSIGLQRPSTYTQGQRVTINTGGGKSFNVNAKNLQSVSYNLMSNGTVMFGSSSTAQRSNMYNAYLNKPDHSALRNALNSGKGYDVDFNQSNPYVNNPYAQLNNEQNWLDKAMQYTAATSMLTQSAVGIANGIKEMTGSSSAEFTPSAILNLQNMKTISSLESGIETASAELANCPTQEDVDTLIAEVGELQTTLDDAEQAVKDNETTISEATQTISGLTPKISMYKTEVKKLSALETQLSIDKANGKDTKMLENMIAVAKKMEQELPSLEKQKTDAEDKLNKANNKKSQLEEDAATAKQNLADKTKELGNKKTQLDNRPALEKGIQEQKARLTKMQTEATKLEEEIGKMIKDGKKRSINKKIAEYEKLTGKQYTQPPNISATKTEGD